MRIPRPRQIRRPFLCWFVIVSLNACMGEEIRFDTQIRPILSEHCLECHGPDADRREAELRLDVDVAAASSASEVVAPGDPEGSVLFQRITSADPDLRMPPDGAERLKPGQILLIKQWIAAGAPYASHWAYQPIQDPRPPLPEHEAADALTAIDRFIVARLAEKELQLAPPVNRQQLIRRATFDLTGLPPTWEEVEAFVNDTSHDAYQKLIDGLLDSPAYGERWGRHWLDLARYADTHGGAAIGFTRFPFSYTYRDYVIRAFNADLPYDRFIIQQLAADQIGLEENAPEHAALGFLTVGMQYRNPHDTIDDQIDVVTRGLLGLTVTCARCHDHKYDAIPTKDYYSLYATFASSRAPDRLPLIGAPPTSDALREYESELRQLQTSYGDMAREQNAVMRGRLRMQIGMYLREIAKGTPEQDLSAAFLSFRTDDLRPHVLNRWQDYLAEMSDEDPVFGPWVQLMGVDSAGFADHCGSLLEALTQQNGERKQQTELHKLSAKAPRWNPRVLQALSQAKPASMLDVADAYGTLFAEVHQQWLHVLIDTAQEAIPGATPVPDEDPRHLDVNSPVNQQLRRHLYGYGTPTNVPDKLASRLLNRPINDNLGGRRSAIHNLDLSSPGSPPRAMAIDEDPLAGPFYVLNRGNPIDRGERVTARFLSTLGGKAFAPGKRRFELAKAIVHPDNPLTRRVLVNWVWQHHFGQGLVRTPDDFGTRGQPPTHPLLLDYLAARFLENGQSIKQLHRVIMLSAVYQQSASEKLDARVRDPDNRLLWRMPRRRLELEAMRDAMLAASGELQTSTGGRPFEMLSEPIVPQRSVYAFVNRDIVSPLMSTFDVADPNSCTARRPKTNVPQQTLFALNSNFIQDRAKAMSKSVLRSTASSDTVSSSGLHAVGVRQLYRRALSREPDGVELKAALDFVASQGENKDAWQRLAHALLATNEFVFVD